MTTVAFVTYEFAGQVRRVGPLEAEPAETFAKELARSGGTKDVTVERWGLIEARKVERP